jgi:hypothetical protein
VTLSYPLRPVPTPPVAVGIPSATVTTGQSFTVPVHFRSMRTDLAGVQFTIGWDAAALRLTGAVAALPGLRTFQPDASHLTLVWADAALAGHSVAINDALVHLTFMAIGPAGTTSVIRLSGDYTAATATNAALEPVGLALTDGLVQIGSHVLSTADLAPLAATFRLWPNPAHGQLQLDGASPATRFILLDINGRRVRSGTTTDDGTARIDLETIIPGIYALRIGSATQRVIVE